MYACIIFFIRFCSKNTVPLDGQTKVRVSFKDKKYIVTDLLMICRNSILQTS